MEGSFHLPLPSLCSFRDSIFFVFFRSMRVLISVKSICLIELKLPREITRVAIRFALNMIAIHEY